MAKKVSPKKRGRPATGRDPVVAGRVPEVIVAEMDAFAKREGITRSAAMAELLASGLKAKRRQ
jgi:hypothetical protein